MLKILQLERMPPFDKSSLSADLSSRVLLRIIDNNLVPYYQSSTIVGFQMKNIIP